jgi:hypothetical protein
MKRAMSSASIRSVLPRATALRKRLHLSRTHLAGCNAFRLQKRRELPLLATSRFKTNNGFPVRGQDPHGSMTCWSVGYFAAMPVGEEMNVKPITADSELY